MNTKSKNTKKLPYKEVIYALIDYQLPKDVALCIGTLGDYLSLRKALIKPNCFSGKAMFYTLGNKEMYAKEVYEEFLKQDYSIFANDGVDEKKLYLVKKRKNGKSFGEISSDEIFDDIISNRKMDYDWREDLSLWEQRCSYRRNNHYQYREDKVLLKECIEKQPPYYTFFLGLDYLYIKELIDYELKREVQEISIKKLFKTIVEKKEKLYLRVEPKQFLKKLIQSIFKSKLLQDESWWDGKTKFEGLYVAFSVVSKKKPEDEDIIIDECVYSDYSRSTYDSPDDYYSGCSKFKDHYISYDKEEHFLIKIDDKPFEISTNKLNPQIVIEDVVLHTKCND